MSALFSSLKLRDVTFKNRLFVSPMCQYSADDGVPNDWHLVHLGSRAVGGAGLVIVEASAVSPEGRISLGDLGIWNESQVTAFQRITKFMKDNGAVTGIQLAHAGRKASTHIPFGVSGKSLSPQEGAWPTLAPSAQPFSESYQTPKAMTPEDLEKVKQQFVDATKRAEKAGFEVVEIHAAHGYLLHEFLSPLSNTRTDEYGGSLENRMRYPLEVIKKTREAWPQNKPFFVRISASDWVENGWDVEQSTILAKEMKKLGSTSSIVRAAVTWRKLKFR